MGLPEIHQLLDAYAEPAVIIGLDYQILAANRSYREQYGELRSHTQPRCFEISHRYTQPCDQAGEVCPIKNCLASGQAQRVLHVHYTAQGEEHVAVEALPIRDDQGQIRYFLEILHKSDLHQQPRQTHGLIGTSSSFTRTLELIERVAPRQTTVLLLGESGTGKELAARAVHELSQRANGPFVPVDCSGLSESLFESELFGHEKGAFTGAQQRKLGLVEAARGGTLFLDEIGEIPLPQQVKLLRLLETASFRRVGGVEPQQADFRLVCATHRNLKRMVEQGRFRQDLFYRINTFPITLPPLRERRDDIPRLCQTLLKRVAPERQLVLHPDTLQHLERYDFPGNIRELRNILERASLLCDGDTLLPSHLPEECRQDTLSASEPIGFQGPIRPLKTIEHDYLRWAATRHRGDKRSLARQLGLSERTLYRKLGAILRDDPLCPD